MYLGNGVRRRYAYDNNGNNTSQNAGGTCITYAWDYENHVTKVTQTGSVVTTLVYDGDGLRRKKQTASDITKFIWDDQDVLIETNDAGTTQVNYTQTPDAYGSLISQRRSSTSRFHFYDALGSTSELTDSSQTQTDSYRYYAFGKSLVSTGSTVNPYQYVGNLGYYNESGLSLQYLRARWYDPNTGRFRSQDPIKDDINHINYVSNNPISRSDPSGLMDMSDEMMLKTYICQVGCFVSFLGIPWDKILEKDLFGVIKEKTPETMNETIKIIVGYMEKKGNRKYFRKWCNKTFYKSIKARDINKTIKEIKKYNKIFGKIIKFSDTIILTYCAWKCVDDNYEVF